MYVIIATGIRMIIIKMVIGDMAHGTSHRGIETSVFRHLILVIVNRQQKLAQQSHLLEILYGIQVRCTISVLLVVVV